MNFTKGICSVIVMQWLASCGGSSNNSGVDESNWFSEERTYHNLIPPFESEQECLDNQDPSFFINCYQSIEFNPDGTAFVILTDIVNVVTYTVDNKFITVIPASGSEFTENIRFYVAENYKSLIQASNSVVWLIKE